MFGGVGKPAGWATILVAGGLVLGGSVTANAADFGGDCCADLEERVAELEATTARKGNRKVSLSVYGWVNEAVFFWDDGTEQNAYVGTNSLEQTRFGFKGKAKISADWSAGYKIEIGVKGADASDFSQADTASENSIGIRKAYWFLKSKKLGEVAVGQNGTATYHAVDDAIAVNTRNYSDFEAAAVYVDDFKLKSGGANIGSLDWGDIMQGFNNNTVGQSGRRNVVRYDSPSFAGFVVTAAWGEDDLWDVAATYKGNVGEFKIKARAGYGESTDPTATNCGGPTADFECTWFGAGATVKHDPSGLYVYGGYGQQTIDTPTFVGEDTSETWLIQGGIEKQWMPIGQTLLFGEYRNDDVGASYSGTSIRSQSADLDFWAAGVVQSIDAAAMDVYAIYRHAEGDFVDAGGTAYSLDDWDMVMTGARIQF